MSHNPRLRLCLLCLALIGPSAATAQDPKPAIAPEARERLEAVVAHYRDLPRLDEAGTLTRRIQTGADLQEQPVTLALHFERPNKLKVSYDGVTLGCDGETLVTVSDALRKYRRQPAPAALTLPDVMVSPLGSMLVGSPAETPLTLVLTLLLSEDPLGSLLEGATSLTLEPGANAESQVLILERAPRPGLRITVDSKSNRITAVDSRFRGEDLAATAPAGTEIKALGWTWTAEALEADPKVFAFEAPAGYSEVVVAKARPAAAPERHKLVGQAAPDFKFDLIDGPGKPRAASKADFAGKVLVIDFWATWCPPCREELPEIQALAARLEKKHAGKVVVLALSQDRAPEEGQTLRALVEKSLEELGVSLLTKSVGRLGLDPEQQAGDAFGVEGIPMVVVVDGQGIVQSVQVGYEEGVGEALENQVESLLAGKSLIEPAGAPNANRDRRPGRN